MRISSSSAFSLVLVVLLACSENTSTLGGIGSTADGGAGAGGSPTTGGTGGSPTTGGTGGSPTTGGTGGSPTTGGAGGSPTAACGPLALDGSPRGIDLVPSDSRRELSPVLVPGDTSATLAYHWTSYPGGTVTGVRYLPFSPFGAWPATDFGPTFGPEPHDLVGPIAAGPGAAGSLAVLAHDPGFGAETGSALFFPAMSAPFESATPLVLESLDVSTPAFVARGGSSHLVGYTVFGAGADSVNRGGLRGGLVTGGTFTQDPLLQERSCATAPVVAAAIPFAGSFLVVQSTSRACCSCDDGIDGPPTAAMLHVLGQDKQTYLPGSDVVQFVALVPRSDGAWVVVGREGGKVGEGSLFVGRVGPDGAVVQPLAGQQTFLYPYAPVAAAALGDDLVLASVRDSGTGSVLVFNTYAVGLPAVRGEVPLASPFASRQPSLLPNAAGTQLVAAWSLPSATEADADRIQLLRLARSCETP